MSRTVVIGLDGCTLKLLRKFIEEGHLSNVEDVKRNGLLTELESTIPPYTGPAWTSFTTGNNPGKHGCFDFLLPQRSLDDRKPINSREIKTKTHYELLDEEGKDSILINLPNSSPPLTDNITITSILTEGNRSVFPENLRDEIEELKNYRIMPDTSKRFGGDLEEYFEDIRKLERNRFEAAKKLFKKKDWGHFFFLVSGTDWIHHKIYDKLLKGEIDNNSQALELYRDVDEYIGWFKENLPDDTTLFLMSDHGFTKKRGYFFLNEWLRKENWLKLTEGERSESKYRWDEELEKDFKKIELPNFFKDIIKYLDFLSPIYVRILRNLPIKIGINTKVDISKSKAFCLRSDGIYINSKERFEDGVVDKDGFKRVKDDIRQKLENIEVDEEKVFEKVIDTEEYYKGDEVKSAPDLIPISKNWEILHEYPAPNITTKIDVNVHRIDGGIFGAYGNNIETKANMDKVSIMDIVPTLLHMMNCKVPVDMDGSVLKNIFKEGAGPAKRNIKREGSSLRKGNMNKRFSKGNEDKVKKRLKHLGYMD